jgi:hypothetical protein
LGYIGLHSLDVPECQRPDAPTADERLYVSFDAAAVHRERRRLDRTPTPAENPSRLGLAQIPITDFLDGQKAGFHRVLGGRIDTL